VRNDDVRIYTVAAGSVQGVDIPADRLGGTEHTAVDRATLERIATETGGTFRDTGTVAGLAVEFARLRQSQFAESTQAAPIERFQWFLGGALLLLVLQTLVTEGARVRPRRATRITLGVTALIAAVIVACGGSSAFKHVRDGNETYEQGRYDRALTEYRQAAVLLPDDPTVAYDTGNALHRLRRFEEATAASAAAAFGAEDRDLQQRAIYALGSHAYRRGALEEARDAFTSVLRSSPDDDDARHNLELILIALAPPAPATPPQASQQSDSGQTEAGDREGDEDEGSDGQGQPGALPAPPTDTTAPGDAASDGGGGGRGTPSDNPTPGESAPSDEASLTAAQQALAEALVGFGTEVSVEEALDILDLVREVNTLTARTGSGLPSGRLPAR
jgi:tetratricopeptide (TPR) repeat protein